MLSVFQSEPSSFLIEGVGERPFGPLDPISENLPSPGGVTYLPAWPLMIFGLSPKRGSYNRRFIQYNPQSRAIRRMILHLNRQPADLSEITDDEIRMFIRMVESGDLNRLLQLDQILADTEREIKEILQKY